MPIFILQHQLCFVSSDAPSHATTLHRSLIIDVPFKIWHPTPVNRRVCSTTETTSTMICLFSPNDMASPFIATKPPSTLLLTLTSTSGTAPATMTL